MRKILISTDQVCDLPEGYYAKHNVLVIPLTYIIEGVEYDDVNKKQLPTLELFNLMRKGCVPKTSQSNPENIKKLFIEKINEGYDIFHLSVSTGISGTHNAIKLAVADIEENRKELVNKQNQDFKIIAIDSLTGAGGLGMLVDYLVQFKDKNNSTLEQLEVEAKRLIPMCCHYFTLDDLGYLARGGRLSKGAAMVGSLIQLKPMLYMEPKEGKLIQIGKAIGRKKSIKTLVDYLERKLIPSLNKVLYISHGDCLKDVEFLKKEITKRFGIDKFVVSLASTIVGAHCGPGSLGVFCWAKDRVEA